jgi:hypothetical protein
MTVVKGEREDDASSLKKSKMRKKRLRKWRHVMEVPSHGGDWQKLWNFVAAHVEDDSRKKACPLAVKAWQLVSQFDKVPYRERTDHETFPSVMPLFRQAKFGERQAKFGERQAKW